jgi:signal peptidase I
MARRSIVHDYFQAAVIAVMMALFVRTYLVQAFQIPSPSMVGTILVGDHILVNKFAYGPTSSKSEWELLPFLPVARGDIVIFKFPGEPEKDYVKRVIGLPGETLKIVNRQVMIKKPGDADFSTLMEKDYVKFTDPLSADDPDHLNNRDPVPIPEGTYYVMGDNRDDSRDSRDWGFVPRQLIRGKALLVYWSVGFPPAERKEAPSGVLAVFWESVSGAFTHTRWKRTFLLIR